MLALGFFNNEKICKVRVKFECKACSCGFSRPDFDLKIRVIVFKI